MMVSQHIGMDIGPTNKCSRIQGPTDRVLAVWHLRIVRLVRLELAVCNLKSSPKVFGTQSQRVPKLTKVPLLMITQQSLLIHEASWILINTNQQKCVIRSDSLRQPSYSNPPTSHGSDSASCRRRNVSTKQNRRGDATSENIRACVPLARHDLHPLLP